MWLLDVNLPTGLVTLLRGYGISCDTTVSLLAWLREMDLLRRAAAA